MDVALIKEFATNRFPYSEGHRKIDGTLSGRSTWEDLEGTNDDPFNAGAPYSVDPRFSGRSSTRKRDYRHRSLNPRWWFSEMVLALINKAATQTAGGKS
jgi:hypothetical protein